MTTVKEETQTGVIRLRGYIQNYPWGKDGSDSLAGQFGKEGVGGDFELDENTPYAELWMGSHPNGPATLWNDPNSKTLSAHLHEHKELLGVANKLPSPADSPTEAHIPFLFKILTCKAALPLQIHPNKELAAELHRKDPEQFVDFNHKPEIAVALKPFQGFVGFRPAKDIAATIQALPELDEILDPKLQEAFIKDPSPDTLKQLFAALLKLPSEKAKPTVQKIAKKVEQGGGKALGQGVPNADKVAEVLVKLEKQYGDPGVLAASVFMNLVELRPGEGIYAGADTAHAWLQGQIVELMATSDNVLNVGMTDDSEKNDIDLFVSTVTCKPSMGDSYKLTSEWFSKSTGNHVTRFFHTPFEEFSIIHIAKEGAETLKPLKGPMVAIVFDGRGKAGAKGHEIPVERGTVLFVGAGTEFSVADGVEVWAALKDE